MAGLHPPGDLTPVAGGSVQGHFDPFPPPRLNGRCPFSQPTSAGASGNGKDGRFPVVRLATVGRLKLNQSGHGDLSTQARVKAAYEFTAQPRLGNGRGALERWPRKQALTIGRGAGTEQRGEVGLSHIVERIADRNVGKRHPPRHQEVTTLQPLLE